MKKAIILGMAVLLSGCSCIPQKQEVEETQEIEEKENTVEVEPQEVEDVYGVAIKREIADKEKFTYWEGEAKSTIKLYNKSYQSTYAYLTSVNGVFYDYDNELVRELYKLDDNAIYFTGSLEFYFDNNRYEVDFENLGKDEYIEVKNSKGKTMFYLEAKQEVKYDELHNITSLVYEIKIRSESYTKFKNKEIKVILNEANFYRTEK